MTDPAAATPPAPPEKAGLFEDFIDIFASPAKVFARRATANPMVPYLIVCVLIIGLFMANKNTMAPIWDAEGQKAMAAAMKANPQMTAEQFRGFMETSITVGAILFAPVGLLLIALVTLITGKVLGGNLSYGTALTIATFSWIPRVIESIFASIQGLVLDVTKLKSHFQLQIGPARFMDPDTTAPGLLGLVGRLDLITLWVTALLAIGLVHAGKLPKGKAPAAGFILWFLGSIFVIWGALRGG